MDPEGDLTEVVVRVFIWCELQMTHIIPNENIKLLGLIRSRS